MYTLKKIGDFATVKGGKRLPKGHGFEINRTHHPYIKAQDIRNGIIDTYNLTYISEETHKRINRYIVQENDVCITIAGNIGDVGIVPKALDRANLTENAVKLVDLEDCDPGFLKYSLLHPDVQAQMKLLAAGAAQPKLGIYKVQSIELPFPPLPTQRKIAAILSAYDDLIENNTRRIRILEEMAQTIYREWFVHFRFPGHEGVRMVESEVGLVPEGWERKLLGDTCNLVMGQSPKSEYYNENGFGLPFHQGVTDFGEHFPTDRIFCSYENRIAEQSDILFSVRAPVGRINIASKKIIIGRGLCAIRQHDGYQWFLYHQLRETFFQEDMIGGGTIFKSVTKQDMQNIQILYPPSEPLSQFEHFSARIVTVQLGKHWFRQVSKRA